MTECKVFNPPAAKRPSANDNAPNPYPLDGECVFYCLKCDNDSYTFSFVALPDRVAVCCTQCGSEMNLDDIYGPAPGAA